MDDDVNRSSDSLPTSEEFELVGCIEPKLHIANNGNAEQLEESMKEVLQDIDDKMLDISPLGSASNGTVVMFVMKLALFLLILGTCICVCDNLSVFEFILI